MSCCEFLLYVQLGDLISNKQNQHFCNLINKYTVYKSICIQIFVYIYIYIYIYSYVHILNYRMREDQTFFSLVTTKSVQNIRGIFVVPQDQENCIMAKNGT